MQKLLIAGISLVAGFSFADPLDHWTRTNVGAPVILRGVAYGNGRWVTVGDNGSIFYSSNALSWSRAQSSAVGSIRALTFGNGRFVAVEGANYENFHMFLTSNDGTHWVRTPSDLRFENVVFGRGLFIAANPDYVIATSTDGTDWRFEGVQSGAMAIGVSDSLFLSAWYATYASSTGTNWTFLAPPPNAYSAFARMAYGNGTFFALAVRASSTEVCYTTVDGSQWTPGETFPRGFNWGDVVFAHDTFAIAGDTGAIYTSTMGTNWVERVPGQFYTDRFATLTYGNGRLAAVGGDGIVIVSDHYGPPVLKISKTPDLRLNVSAEKDKLCIVEQSEDLLHWSEVTRYTNSAETVEITALSPTNAAAVFRVRTD